MIKRCRFFALKYSATVK